MGNNTEYKSAGASNTGVLNLLFTPNAVFVMVPEQCETYLPAGARRGEIKLVSTSG